MYNYKVERLLNNLDKAYRGPVIPMKEWDTKIIPKTIKGILKKHKLQNTLDMENPINYDDELADRFFKAGWELALELGLYCEDTERVIKVDESEILECIRDYQKEIILGEGQDQVIMKPRRPEDPYVPLLCASLGIVCSEENYLPLVQGLVKYNKLVDVLCGPTLATVFGRTIRSGTPYETLMGNYESQLKKEALWRAGRPGMACMGVAGAVTEYGHLGGAPAVAGQGNVTLSLCPVELKCTFSNFHPICLLYTSDIFSNNWMWQLNGQGSFERNCEQRGTWNFRCGRLFKNKGWSYFNSGKRRWRLVPGNL